VLDTKVAAIGQSERLLPLFMRFLPAREREDMEATHDEQS
jgi:hypothetical protein